VSPNRARFATWRTCSSDIMPGLRSLARRTRFYLSAAPAILRTSNGHILHPKLPLLHALANGVLIVQAPTDIFPVED
jgi:hypothetical protein